MVGVRGTGAMIRNGSHEETHWGVILMSGQRTALATKKDLVTL